MKIGWKTVTGALVFGVGVLSSPEATAILPANISHIIQAAGGILSVLGLRHAQAKAEQAARDLAAAVGGSAQAFREK